MKIKKIVLITASFFAYQASSQTSSSSTPNNTTLKEEALKASEQRKERKNQVANTPGTNQNGKIQSASQGFQLNENDTYQGRKDEFLSMMIIKELPENFPKYEKWMGVKHYNEVVDQYYKQHLEILKETVKQKLSQK